MWLSGKESTCQAGDMGLIPGLGRSPGEGNGNPLEYSCLGNSMDRGAWRATVHVAAESWTQLERLSSSVGGWQLWHGRPGNAFWKGELGKTDWRTWGNEPCELQGGEKELSRHQKGKFKGPEWGVCLECARNTKEASVPGWSEWRRGCLKRV